MCWWTVLPILVHSQDSAAPAYQTMSGDSNSHSCVRWRVLTLVKNTNGWDYVKLRVRWRVWWPTDINWWGILNLNPTYKKRYLLYCVPATPNTYVLQSRDFSVILLLLVFLQRQIRSSLFAEVGDPTYDDVVDGTVALNHKRTHTLISSSVHKQYWSVKPCQGPWRQGRTNWRSFNQAKYFVWFGSY